VRLDRVEPPPKRPRTRARVVAEEPLPKASRGQQSELERIIDNFLRRRYLEVNRSFSAAALARGLGLGEQTIRNHSKYLEQEARPASALLVLDVLLGIAGGDLARPWGYRRTQDHAAIFREVYEADVPDPNVLLLNLKYHRGVAADVGGDADADADDLHPYPDWVRKAESIDYNALRKMHQRFRDDFRTWLGDDFHEDDERHQRFRDDFRTRLGDDFHEDDAWE
jgi:hypothetical protein